MIENVAVHAGHVHVRPAVIVVIGSGNTHAIAFAANASAVGDIRERSIAVVVIQAVEKDRAILGQARDARAVGEENVEAAIIVIIEKGNAPESAIDDRLVGNGAIFQHKSNARLLLPVLEANLGIFRTLCALRTRGSGPDPARPE